MPSLSRLAILPCLLLSFMSVPAAAVVVEIDRGQTSAALDPTLLGQAGLILSSTSGEVVPGALPNSFGFPINSRDAVAPAAPTTFSYDPSDFFGTFSGTIEHSGSLFFNEDQVQMGNFSLAFDASRVGEGRSGFFVSSTAGLMLPIGDIADTAVIDAQATSLRIEGDALVSAELAELLQDPGMQGLDVGAVLVEAPEPRADLLAICALLGLQALHWRTRRSAPSLGGAGIA